MRPRVTKKATKDGFKRNEKTKNVEIAANNALRPTRYSTKYFLHTRYRDTKRRIPEGHAVGRVRGLLARVSIETSPNWERAEISTRRGKSVVDDATTSLLVVARLHGQLFDTYDNGRLSRYHRRSIIVR